jgi:IS5 family transposase
MRQTDPGLNLRTRRKREFLAQMDRVMPWADLVAVVSPYTRKSKTGRPPFAVLTMLRIHFMQHWFTLSAPAMGEAPHDVPLFREFAGPSLGDRLPDESTILLFRYLLEKHKLADQVLTTVNELL